jgi:RHS repeat-associated protein
MAFGLGLDRGADVLGKGSYRFAFNGKEIDNQREWGNSTTAYDYGFRIYNPAVARFLSVDPLTNNYPWNSPYSFAEGDVLRAIDLDGLERALVLNFYSDGRQTRTVITVVQDRYGNQVNLRATGATSGGESISGLTKDDILEFNFGNMPNDVPSTRIKQNFSEDEQRIIDAGADTRNTLYDGSNYYSDPDRLQEVDGISFPGAKPLDEQYYIASGHIGTYNLVPVKSTRTVTETYRQPVPFPPTVVENSPFSIDVSAGRIAPDPVNRQGYNQLQDLFIAPVIDTE